MTMKTSHTPHTETLSPITPSQHSVLTVSTTADFPGISLSHARFTPEPSESVRPAESGRRHCSTDGGDNDNDNDARGVPLTSNCFITDSTTQPVSTGSSPDPQAYLLDDRPRLHDLGLSESLGSQSSLALKEANGSKEPHDFLFDSGQDTSDNKKVYRHSSKRRRIEPQSDIQVVSRYACPLSQRNPRQILSHSCARSGFPNVQRLKEHLIRVHVPKHRCRRCSRVFKDSTALGFHHIQSVECDRGEPYPRIAESSTAGYITLEQEEKLRGRVASKRSEGEENKWWAVYHVLFPNDDSTHISPYWKYMPTSNEETSSTLHWGTAPKDNVFVTNEFLHRLKALAPAEKREEFEAWLDSISGDIKDILESWYQHNQRLHSVKTTPASPETIDSGYSNTNPTLFDSKDDESEFDFIDFSKTSEKPTFPESSESSKLPESPELPELPGFSGLPDLSNYMPQDDTREARTSG